MKSLSLTTPHVIFVVGIPGSGKTAFAEKFAETFNTPLVSHQRIAMHLFGDRVIDKTEQAVVAQIASYMLGQLLKTGKSIVMDGGAHSRADRQKLAQALRSAGYNMMLVWIQTEPLTAKMRATKRTRLKSDGVQPISDDQFDRLLRRFTPPNSLESHVVVSGRHTYAAQLRAVLKKLAAPRTDIAVPTVTERPTKGRITIR